MHYALQRLDDARHATKWNILLALATQWKFQLQAVDVIVSLILLEMIIVV